jgi:hypothetical protein
VGLNPDAIYVLDGCKRFASYYIKRKIENKGSQMGHNKKKYLQKNGIRTSPIHNFNFFVLLPLLNWSSCCITIIPFDPVDVA